MAENYDDFLRELSKRTGASVEQSDVAALQGKNPEDVEAHKRALEQQYAKRGSNVPGSSAPSSNPAQSWNSAPASPFPSWYGDMMQQQIAQQQAAQAETKARADALYANLNTRATQGLAVNANDPIIKGQVDAYGAQQERARRNYLSDTAERSGPYANLRGEQRMTAEKVGQGVGAFQSELLGRELGSRRDEIAQALAMQGGMLQGDQQRELQMKLAAMDQAIGEAGIGLQGRGLDLQRDLGFAGLGMQERLGQGGLDLQRMLGLGGLGLQKRGQDLGQDQFLRELALREWDLGNQSDYRWSGL